jgi:hypothetical protein
MTSAPVLPEQTAGPAVQTGPVVEAARAALRPPGPARWIINARSDRVELRTVVRRWSTAVEPSARLTRIACGTVLQAIRLALAAQGRRPLVSHPDQPGLLAVVYPGAVVAPRREDLLLQAMLRCGTDRTRDPARPADRPSVVRRLRQAAESEGAWLRVLPEPPASAATLGPCWSDVDDHPRGGPTREPVFAVIGAPGRSPAADLRAGQALETVRLTAMTLSLDVQVLAAPAAPTTPAVSRCVGRTSDTLAVVRIGRPDRGDEEGAVGERRAR